jgi:hypothetical protein
MQDPHDCSVFMGALDEIGIKIANIGLQFLHLKEGALLVGNMACAYPISNYLINQHAITKCL